MELDSPIQTNPMLFLMVGVSMNDTDNKSLRDT